MYYYKPMWRTGNSLYEREHLLAAAVPFRGNTEDLLLLPCP